MENLVGRRFDALTVIAEEPREKYKPVKVICRCNCGNIKTVLAGNLKRGYTRSCGCGIAQSNAKFTIELNRDLEITAWMQSGAHSKREVEKYLQSLIADQLNEE